MQALADLKLTVVRARMAFLEAEATESRGARNRVGPVHVVTRGPSLRWRIGHALMLVGAAIADVVLEVRRPASTDPCTTVGRLY